MKKNMHHKLTAIHTLDELTPKAISIETRLHQSLFVWSFVDIIFTLVIYVYANLISNILMTLFSSGFSRRPTISFDVYD
jgi:hypothetical protein